MERKKAFIAYLNDNDETKTGDYEIVEYLPGSHIKFYDNAKNIITIPSHRLLKIKENNNEEGGSSD